MLFEPGAAERTALAEALQVPEVRKLRLAGRLIPEGRRDWRLEAEIGATVIQSCVVTLAPVTTRIDEPVTRRYLAEMPADEAEPGGEMEMPEDTDAEPMPETIDLAEIALEALALALPIYPRAEGAAPGDTVHAGPGVTPMTDEDARPFAGLAALRRSLADEGSDEG